MTINKIIVFLIFFSSLNISYGQNTVRIKKKPKIILHSWYPDFKVLTKFKIGESKLFYTTTSGFEKSSLQNKIHNFDVDLKTSNSKVIIEETVKSNQFIITINATDAKYLELEVWFDLRDETILVQQNGKWKNIKELYIVKGNRILIDTIKVELIK